MAASPAAGLKPPKAFGLRVTSPGAAPPADGRLGAGSVTGDFSGCRAGFLVPVLFSGDGCRCWSGGSRVKRSVIREAGFARVVIGNLVKSVQCKKGPWSTFRGGLPHPRGRPTEQCSFSAVCAAAAGWSGWSRSWMLSFRRENEDKSFDCFVTRVKEQAKKCSFSVLHDSLVKDRIIIGVKYLQLVPQLLNDELTLQKTIELCRNHELTAMQSRAMIAEEKIDAVKVLKKKSNDNSDTEVIQCGRCVRKHKRSSCPAYGKECRSCGRKGHFAAQCKIQNTVRKPTIHTISEKNNSDSEEELFIGAIETEGEDWYQTVRVGGKTFSAKLDSGATVGSSKKFEITSLATVQYEMIVKETVTPILGRKTCIAQQLIARVNDVQVNDSDIYNGLGCVKNYVYDIDLIDNPQWKMRPARHVPHSIRDAVKKELDSMEKLGVIERIHDPTPVVNQNLLRRHHPLSTLEEISTRLSKSKYFTILDCTKGFWQIPVTDRTAKFLTFGTPWGRYCCKRLPFGLASAPEVFQKIMQDTLDGLDGVEYSMDDILIHAESLSQLKDITENVIRRLHEKGLKLNKEKCVFNQSKAKFLGHLVSKDGLSADPDKLDAVRRLNTPTNKQELQRALEMITYLAKFVPNLSKITEPLRRLLAKDAAWVWEVEQEKAFQDIKNLMISPPVLAFYDVNKPVTLSVDASSNALGAVLIQNERPVAYASKALSVAEKNYPQIEKEAAVIRFACQKFH
ncbi:uncharacterized protein LOC131428145 [Malaya genurostris]|uniref:uncharacterized protein LOC131428145 n=1 Tax=Malaya genurostris TaxID=325434 RepID=UPI0026F38BDC|nr:uncharacterized protein LOC131428145 [Malaya genurostris]